jgi:CRISPR system Cascade subunit CasC
MSWLTERVQADKKNFKAMLQQAGINAPAAGFEGAMFGRFVTSDLLARVDAPVHVAHAFTTHALDTEVDFFTVVDDLADADETGAAHANDTELGAGIFYGYVAVDVPLLVSNLTGSDTTNWRAQESGGARQLLDRLVHAIATVTPGAKLGATAPYARAEHVVLEVSTGQPRSLANSFLQPVRMNGRDQPMTQSVGAMADYLDALTKMYGDDVGRRTIASLHPWPREGEKPQPLNDAIAGALDALFEAGS